ncbi:MAG: hypothetical protein MN733_10415 [Nitrososphaera sp.]|nr:hypothetical protein [Nitrososphaera sp.]
MPSRVRHPGGQQSSNWQTYRLFGLVVRSDFPLSLNPLNVADDEEEALLFTCSESPPLEYNWEHVKASYASSILDKHNRSVAFLFELAECDVMRFTDSVDFYLWRDRIICHLRHPIDNSTIESHLLGSVLSLWFERQGLGSLHASAVIVENRAVAFMAASTGGKTSLAATFVNAGYPLLTDDVLILEQINRAIRARPGYPQMRMWPAQAHRLFADKEAPTQAHISSAKLRIPIGNGGKGCFQDTPVPLRCFYVLERHVADSSGEEARITPLSASEAVIEFIRHSSSYGAIQAIRRHAGLFNFFVELARRVPVRKLSYPEGFLFLPRIREMILADLATIS